MSDPTVRRANERQRPEPFIWGGEMKDDLHLPGLSGHPFVDSGRQGIGYNSRKKLCEVCEGFEHAAIHVRSYAEKRWGWTEQSDEQMKDNGPNLSFGEAK